MSTIIRVENISKRYFIGHQASDKYLTFRDVISRGAKNYAKNLLHPFRSSSGQPLQGGSNIEEFWALKDISFDVEEGDRIAIIGRNGAGKSTLLKILSRITEPSSGQFEINGRVASLLEVGTGFHQELSGRENIYLNGAILGMKRDEIKRKFDEIVSFAGVERFLDTPVKRYSSGMHVRLAFAVAAHLDPEVLIIDEVLAVGDAEFQKKCLGKMNEVSRQGRTVLFVSHNMHAVQKLCNKGILLENGKLQSLGTVNEIVDQYLKAEPLTENTRIVLPIRQTDKHLKSCQLISCDENGKETSSFKLREAFYIELEFELLQKCPHVIAAIGLVTSTGTPLTTYWSEPSDLMPGVYSVRYKIDLPFKTCNIHTTIGFSSRERTFSYFEGVGNILIQEVDKEGEQPFRVSGGGILLGLDRPAIMSITNSEQASL